VKTVNSERSRFVNMKHPLLHVENIRQYFEKTVALADISLDLPEGEILTILGPSGCGKTTFLRVVAGLQRPDYGTIEIDGRTVNGPGIWVSPQKRSVAMIFQNLALWPHLSVKRSVELGLKEKGLRKAERAYIIGETLERLGLSQKSECFPHTLSSGEQQRVALARALVLRPRLLLLDEPFSHLDWELRQDLTCLIKGLETTTIFVTHDQLDAFAMEGLLAIMRKGRLEQIGKQEEVIKNPATEFVQSFVRKAASLLRG